MSFINDSSPPTIQHRNWNWKLGQASSAAAAAFMLVVGVSQGSKYSATGNSPYTKNNFNPRIGGPGSNWTYGAWGSGKGFSVVSTNLGAAVSADGISWTVFAGALPSPAPFGVSANNNMNRMIYARALGKFAVCDSSGLAVMTSSDGQTWGSVSPVVSDIGALCYSVASGRTFAATTDLGVAYYYSDDLAAWNSVASAAFTFTSATNPLITGVLDCGAYLLAFGSVTFNYGGPGSQTRGAIWKSTNNGTTWANVYLDPRGFTAFSSLCFEGAASLTGSPVGIQGYYGDGTRYMLESTTSGVSWSSVATGAANIPDRWQGLTYRAGYFYATKPDGGVWRSTSALTLALIDSQLAGASVDATGPITDY